MANGRCRMHGGSSTGAPEGNQNAKKHGLFSQSLNNTGLAIYQAAKDLDASEIARDTAEFIVAKVAEAYEYSEDLENFAGNELAQFVRDKVISQEMRPEVAARIMQRVYGPDVTALGRILSPLKGLLELKAQTQEEEASLDDDLAAIEALQSESQVEEES